MKTKTFNIKTLLSIALIVGLTLVSCKKKEDIIEGNTITNPVGGNVNSITTSIVGLVVDKNNSPVSGAMVLSGSSTTTTNQDGFFEFQNKLVNEKRAYIKIEKSGYFHASRSITPIANSLHKVKVMMLDNAIDGTFDAATGGNVSLSNGAKVDFVANSLVDDQGNAYTGTVGVALEYYDPTAREFSQYMPGNLEAISNNGQEVGLASLGMLGVELKGASGQKLQIANGQTSTITIPTPYTSAPATLPLWYFDETAGVWKEDGSATLNGNEYTGSVSHFTIWNADIDLGPTVKICSKIVGSTGSPIPNINIAFSGSIVGNFGTVKSDSTGNFCYNVPENTNIDITIYDDCGNQMYNSNLGSFSSSQALPSVSLTSLPNNSLAITGNILNCAGNPIQNGYIRLYFSEYRIEDYNVVNGIVNLLIYDLNCNLDSLSYIVYDLDSMKYDSTFIQIGGANAINIGNINTCDAIDNYILIYDSNNEAMLFNNASIIKDTTTFIYTHYNLSGVNYSTNKAIYFYGLRLNINDSTEVIREYCGGETSGYFGNSSINYLNSYDIDVNHIDINFSWNSPVYFATNSLYNLHRRPEQPFVGKARLKKEY